MAVSVSDAFAAWELTRLKSKPLIIDGLITLHSGQEKVKLEAKRFNVVACGRRWGKTRLGVWLACKRLAIAKSFVGWFAPNYKYLNEAWDEIYLYLKDSGVIESSNKTERIIKLINGSLIEFWSMEDEDAGRSRRYHLVIIDEAAKQSGMSGRWQKAIRPTLADFVGSAWFLSTPKGSTGFFFNAFQYGQSSKEDYSDWMSWQMPTTSNPYISVEEIDAAENDTPALVFRQEWKAEFVQPAGAIYDCFDSRVETSETGETNVVSGFKWNGEPIHLGWDFGSANTAATALAEVSPGKYIAFKTYHSAGDDATLHVQRMRQKVVGKVKSAWGGAPSEDDWRERFRKAGMHVRRPKVSSVDTGISIVYKLLREKRLKIDISCENLINELLSYSYKVDGDDRVTDLIEDKSIYHRADSLRYVAAGLEGSITPKKYGSKFDKQNLRERDILPLPARNTQH